MATTVPHYPGRTAIDAYGDGGFRFGDMSHKGSILLLPSGVYAWPVGDVAELRPEHFAQVIAERERIAFVILGCGEALAWPAEDVRQALRDSGIGLEPMDTGAAARTYNVLLGEGRDVAGALIAVEGPV
jgi:uncharacterized protein